MHPLSCWKLPERHRAIHLLCLRGRKLPNRYRPVSMLHVRRWLLPEQHWGVCVWHMHRRNIPDWNWYADASQLRPVLGRHIPDRARDGRLHPMQLRI